MRANEARPASPIGRFAEVARLLASSAGSEAVVRAAVDAVVELTGAARAAVALPEADGMLRYAIAGGPVDPVTLRGYAFAPGEGIVGRAYAERRGYRVDDLWADERSHRPNLDRTTGVRAFMVAPLVAHDTVLGALAAGADAPGAFSAEHEELLGLLADQVAVALHNARLLEETRRLRADEAVRARRAEEFARVLGEVAIATDARAALEALVRGAVGLLEGGRGFARLFGSEVGVATVRLRCGPDGAVEEQPTPYELPAGSIARRMAADEPALLVEDYARLDPARYAYHASQQGSGMRSGVHAPIQAGERRIGSLHVEHPAPGFYDPTDLALAQALAAQAGAAIARAAVLEELEAILDAAKDTVLVYGADGRLLRANRRARESLVDRFGQIPPTLTAFRDAARPQRHNGEPLADAEIAQALRGEVAEDELSLPATSVGGGERRIHVTIGPVRERGEVRAIVVISRDITALHAAITERAQLSGAIAAARTVSHELNNRLQLLISYGELIPGAGRAEAEQMTGEMVAVADAIAETVARLQRIVRFEETTTPVGPALDLDASTSPDARPPV